MKYNSRELSLQGSWWLIMVILGMLWWWWEKKSKHIFPKWWFSDDLKMNKKGIKHHLQLSTNSKLVFCKKKLPSSMFLSPAVDTHCHGCRSFGFRVTWMAITHESSPQKTPRLPSMIRENSLKRTAKFTPENRPKLPPKGSNYPFFRCDLLVSGKVAV